LQQFRRIDRPRFHSLTVTDRPLSPMSPAGYASCQNPPMLSIEFAPWIIRRLKA
jgi:hypothetical protein